MPLSLPAKFKNHGRTFRALLAVLAAAALAVFLFSQQKAMDEARQRAIFAVSATAWKVSEMIFETERLATVFCASFVMRRP